jgi:hypothetical protein
LLRRVGLVFLFGGFAVFQVPRAVIGLASGDPNRQIAAAVGLAFWAWLTWRLVISIKNRDASQDPRYWFTSATGYAVFFGIYLAFEVWDAVDGDFDARSAPFAVLVFGLAVVSLAAGRRVMRMAAAN